MEIFNITDLTEYEANLFATNLLIDEELMLTELKEGKDIVESPLSWISMKSACPETHGNAEYPE